MPPSTPIMASAGACSSGWLAAVASPTVRHSKPRSTASRRVECTQTSVVTPQRMSRRMPKAESSAPRVVLWKAP